jgi:hypothetical protein
VRPNQPTRDSCFFIILSSVVRLVVFSSLTHRRFAPHGGCMPMETAAGGGNMAGPKEFPVFHRRIGNEDGVVCEKTLFRLENGRVHSSLSSSSCETHTGPFDYSSCFVRRQICFGGRQRSTIWGGDASAGSSRPSQHPGGMRAFQVVF